MTTKQHKKRAKGRGKERDKERGETGEVTLLLAVAYVNQANRERSRRSSKKNKKKGNPSKLWHRFQIQNSKPKPNRMQNTYICLSAVMHMCACARVCVCNVRKEMRMPMRMRMRMRAKETQTHTQMRQLWDSSAWSLCRGACCRASHGYHLYSTV